MPTLPAESVDSIVTDPPYGLSFMGKDWDHGVPGVQFWREALRVAKPGAFLLAFGGTRTFHRLAVAIEDAGWEMRDTVMWVYGSGFPKSHNLKGDWTGWGTALKPAWEPIIVARKPLIGTVAENVLRYGTGAINVDGARVGTALAPVRYSQPVMNGGRYGAADGRRTVTTTPAARWPANLIHDGSDEVAAGFPVAGGGFGKRGGRGGSTVGEYGLGATMEDVGYGDTGSAARFFYCAKASKADRDEGCEGLEAVTHQSGMGGAMPVDDGGNERDRFKAVSRNHHPTVKPTALMRYLVKLVTRRGGVVLDPFMGSGSTGKACAAEGMEFIGIDLSPEYCEIAARRIAAVVQPALTG